MISTVIFDLGNVLLHFDHALIAKNLHDRAALAEPRLKGDGGFRALATELERGGVEPDAFIDQSRRMLGCEDSCSKEHFLDAWNNIFWRNDALVSLLPQLSRVCKLVMLSNTNCFHADYARKMFPDVFDAFSDLVFSYEVKAAKPEPDIFIEALRRADAQPGECLYFDDIMANVEAASGIGIHAYQYVSVEGVADALSYHGM